MKKTAQILAAVATIAFATNSQAADRNVVFAGYSFGEDNSYAYFGGATALNGNLDKNGLLLRVGGGYGQYNYSTPAVSTQHADGQVSSTDLMLGYSHHFNKSNFVTLYAGGNYDNYKLDQGDNGNRVAGGKAGGKVQFEAFLNPIKNISITNITNYTSVYNAYWTQTSVGYQFGKVTFGPEVAFLGNRAFNQQRFGARFSEIKLGALDLYVAGGYLKSSGKAGDDGAYTTIGFASRF